MVLLTILFLNISGVFRNYQSENLGVHFFYIESIVNRERMFYILLLLFSPK